MPETRLSRAEAGLRRRRHAATAWPILYGLLACIAVTALSVGFLDRPIALFVHAQSPARPGILQNFTLQDFLQAMTRIPELLGALAIFLIVGLGLLRLVRGRLARVPEIGFLAALSMIVAEAIKTALKLACGRTWPETWVNNNPSFLRDGIYGFFPFHGGHGWAAFPSGHTTIVCACMAVLWLLLPRWRPLYALAIAATALGLLGMNYHFLGDILAGAYLGCAVGVATVRIGSAT